MSVAEKLIAQGREEGISQGISQGREEGISQGISRGRESGLWIGRIQLLEEFLDLPISSGEALAALSLEELKAMQEQLHGEYELRFKRR
jgi:flagellar biosynthesis/type III secretory pathway protein FliH